MRAKTSRTLKIEQTFKGELGYPVTLGTDTFGNITRLDNALEGLPKRLEMNEMELDNLKSSLKLRRSMWKARSRRRKN